MKSYLRRTWAEVDIDALKHNFDEIRASVDPKAKIICVIKADAYGHGDQVVAKYLSDVEYESEVVLLGKSGDEVITADDLANLIGTIGYEIICEISKRVEKVYID